MKTAPSAETNQATGNLLGYKSLSLWLWVAGAFLLLGLVWAVLFTVAHGAQVQSVPLATQGGRP